MAATDIAHMRQRNPGPHAGTLKARVIATKGPSTYTSGGDQRQSLIVGLADMTGAAKAVIYDSAQFQRYQAGQSVVIRNFILRADGSVIVTRNSRTFSTSSIVASDGFASAASGLVHPPEAPFMSLEQAAASPAKTLVSVRGHIVQEDLEREVMVGSSPTRVKDITISDNRRRVKLTLWREACDMPHGLGTFIQVTNAVTNVHRGDTSLSLTSRSVIQTAEAPLDERVVTIEGVGGDQETKELLADDGECYLVATEVLSDALPGEDIDTFITQNAPVTLRLFMRGATVERVHAM